MAEGSQGAGDREWFVVLDDANVYAIDGETVIGVLAAGTRHRSLSVGDGWVEVERPDGEPAFVEEGLTRFGIDPPTAEGPPSAPPASPPPQAPPTQAVDGTDDKTPEAGSDNTGNPVALSRARGIVSVSLITLAVCFAGAALYAWRVRPLVWRTLELLPDQPRLEGFGATANTWDVFDGGEHVVFSAMFGCALLTIIMAAAARRNTARQAVSVVVGLIALLAIARLNAYQVNHLAHNAQDYIADGYRMGLLGTGIAVALALLAVAASAHSKIMIAVAVISAVGAITTVGLTTTRLADEPDLSAFDRPASLMQSCGASTVDANQGRVMVIPGVSHLASDDEFSEWTDEVSDAVSAMRDSASDVHILIAIENCVDADKYGPPNPDGVVQSYDLISAVREAAYWNEGVLTLTDDLHCGGSAAEVADCFSPYRRDR